MQASNKFHFSSPNRKNNFITSSLKYGLYYIAFMDNHVVLTQTVRYLYNKCEHLIID